MYKDINNIIYNYIHNLQLNDVLKQLKTHSKKYIKAHNNISEGFITVNDEYFFYLSYPIGKLIIDDINGIKTNVEQSIYYIVELQNFGF